MLIYSKLIKSMQVEFITSKFLFTWKYLLLPSIRSGSSILPKFGNKCQTTEKNLEVIDTTCMPLFSINFE